MVRDPHHDEAALRERAVKRTALAVLRDRAVAHQRVFAGTLALATGLVQGLVTLALGGFDALSAGFTVVLTTVGSSAILVGKRQLKRLAGGSRGGPAAPSTRRLPTARLL
jgi:hypothetical protein